MAKFLRKKEVKQKKEHLKFKIDCREPAEDDVIVMEDFEDFLKKRIKVNGKKGNLGDNVTVSVENKNNLVVTAEIPLAKRYLKYLTKKYLKKNNIRDYLRVVATDKTTYQLRYFNIQNEEAEEAE
jgi:Ribosomal L22e protein family.